MSIGNRFKDVSAKVVSKFASKGMLLQPTSYDYDPDTGDQVMGYVPYAVDYVSVTNKTNPDTSLKASSFREKVLYFTTDQFINETWGLLTGTFDMSALDWFEENRELWLTEDQQKWTIPLETAFDVQDIITVEKIEVADVIVGYYALVRIRV